MTRDEVRQAIFGISDGAATTLGAMACLYVAGHHSAILPATIGAGVSATESMGGGEYLSDDDSSLPRAAAMSLGTAIGGLAPAVPFVFTDSLLALLLAAVVTVLLGVWVAEARLRGGRCSRRRAYAQVFALFTVICASTALIGVGV